MPSSFFATIKSMLAAPNPVSRAEKDPKKVPPASGGHDPNSPLATRQVPQTAPHGTEEVTHSYTDPDDGGLDKCPEFGSIGHRPGGSAFPVSIPWFIDGSNTSKQQACSSAVPSFTSPAVIPIMPPTANQPSIESVINPRPVLAMPPTNPPEDYPIRPPLVFSQPPIAPVYRVGPFEVKF